MTNIQTLPSKSQPADNGRSEMGNFFQAAGLSVAGNLSNPDFDSFMGDRESKTQAEELQEEQEAAKKRKKAIDAALNSPLTQQDNTLQKTDPVLSTENTKLSEKNEDASAPSVSKSVEEKAVEKKEEATENQESLEQEADAKTYSGSRGTETAPRDDEMIALSTADGSAAPPQALREPAITTINRLSAYATIDRTSVTPVSNTGSANDSGLGSPASGLPTPIQTTKAQPTSASSQATSLFKALAPELDKFKQTGSSQIQLDLPIGDEESVRVKLTIRGGEIRSTFITETPELRDALQKAWPEFSQNSRDRGYRMGDPSFQQSFHENGSSLGENSRRQSDNRSFKTSEDLATSAIRKTNSNRSTAAKASPTALWA